MRSGGRTTTGYRLAAVSGLLTQKLRTMNGKLMHTERQPPHLLSMCKVMVVKWLPQLVCRTVSNLLQTGQERWQPNGLRDCRNQALLKANGVTKPTTVIGRACQENVPQVIVGAQCAPLSGGWRRVWNIEFMVLCQSVALRRCLHRWIEPTHTTIVALWRVFCLQSSRHPPARRMPPAAPTHISAGTLSAGSGSFRKFRASILHFGHWTVRRAQKRLQKKRRHRSENVGTFFWTSCTAALGS